MTTQEKINVGMLLIVIALVISCIVMLDKAETVRTQRNQYQRQRDSIQSDYDTYKSNVEATLDTCFIIGRSSHKIQKYIRK